MRLQGQVERREVQLKDGGARVAARVRELLQEIADVLKLHAEAPAVRPLSHAASVPC